MAEKRCIFHIPNHIDAGSKSGSSIRPKMMIKAFEENGYIVDCIMGYGKERKAQIAKIKKNILDGVNYDFMYAENSTMPTLLTEKNHFPKYPFLDFGFFKFCKKHGIKIGLFYRDVYWKFPVYKEEVSKIKQFFSIPMYEYDLKEYKKYVDVLYLPSLKMEKYVNVPIKTKALPPGCSIVTDKTKVNTEESDNLRLFYVGGVGELYDLTKLLQVVKELKKVKFTICCREQEWEERKEYYKPNMSDNVEIIHKSGKELEYYYDNADVCMLFFESEGYRSFAMPIKLFEYLGHFKPIIATENTATGEFVEKEQIGWCIAHDVGRLKALLEGLLQNRDELNKVQNNMWEIAPNNCWKIRARTVIDDLTG